MSEKPNGYGRIVIGGQSRPFHVGLNQAEIFSQIQHRRGEDGLPLSLMAYSELFSLKRIKNKELASGDLRDFVYSALASGYEVDGLRVDFNFSQVGYMIDDADPVEVAKPLNEMINQLVKRYERQLERGKNAQAPPATKPAKGAKKPKPAKS